MRTSASSSQFCVPSLTLFMLTIYKHIRIFCYILPILTQKFKIVRKMAAKTFVDVLLQKQFELVLVFNVPI